MPLYIYRAEDGEEVEKLFGMNDAKPSALLRDIHGNEKLEWGGQGALTTALPAQFDETTSKRFARVWGNLQIDDGRHRQYPYASTRLADKISPEDAEIKDVVVRGVPHEKLPIIRSPEHEKELAKKYNLVRE